MPNIVDIIVRSKDQTKGGFSSAKGEAQGFQGSLKRVGETAAGFLSANLIAGAADRIKTFISGSITAASDLNETMSKTDAVFGTSAGNIHDWAKGAVDSMGLSRNAAETAAGSLGLIFTQMGATGGAAAGMSEKWVQLASDIGSFNNADPTEVLDAMQGATRGEYDALQKYVPTISAAAVQHEALAMTGKHSADELTAHDNLLAVQKIMFEQTTKAQGDFARTGDQNANSQKKASAAMENAQAALGKGLLPVMTLGAQVMERLGKIMSTHPGLIMALAAVVGGILVAAFTAWAISAGTAAAATLAAAWPVLAIIAVIALVVAAIFLLAKHWHTIWNAIKAVAVAVWHGIQAAVGAGVNFVKTVISTAWNWIKARTAAVWNGIKFVISSYINGIRAILAAVAGFFRTAWERASSAVKTVVGGLVSFVKGIPGKILSALGDLGSLLYNAGKAVIQGLIDGIKNMIGAVGSAVGGVASTIRNFLPFSPAKEGPLSGSGSPFKAGQKIAQMVGEGIGSGRAGVGGAMGGMLGPAGSRAASGVVRLEISSGGSRLDDLLVELLRKSVRARGGDVQVVLGSA